MAPVRRALPLTALLVALTTAAPRARAGDPPADSGTACALPAFLLEEDAGLLAAYDGFRRGLEDAHLPRVCRRRVDPDTPESWARVAKEVSASPPPFVVAFGRRAIARAAAAPFLRAPGLRIPLVAVDVAWVVRGAAMPSAPDVPVPAAIVRAEAPVERWTHVLSRLLPGRPSLGVRLAWKDESPEAARLRRAAADAAGLDLRLARDGIAGADAVLDWSPDVGEKPEAFDDVLREARSLRVPLLSSDRGRFGRGAAVVLAPDHALLGRVAADAARRLRDGEGADAPLRLAVRATEVSVDLEAADAEGLAPPLSFLATADRLRRALPGTEDGP
jgi:hypothetical protein